MSIYWTAPGDDEDRGIAFKYDLRYSGLPITEGNFEQAKKAEGLPTPERPGTIQHYTFRDLEPGYTYYFAVKTGDEVENWSDISNVYIQQVSVDTCEGIAGNVDCSPDGKINISDLVALTKYLFSQDNPDCPCISEANIDSDQSGSVDISDLTALLRYLFKGGDEPGQCQ